MQILPSRQLSCDGLLRITQFAPDGPKLLLGLFHPFLGIEVDALARFVEEPQRPAVGAAEGAFVAVDRFLGALEGSYECMWTREGGEDGEDRG